MATITVKANSITMPWATKSNQKMSKKVTTISMSTVWLKLSRHRAHTEATEDHKIEVMADLNIEGEVSLAVEEDR